MTIEVILNGPGGELDRVSFETEARQDDPDFDDIVNDCVAEILNDWRFGVGDTITIREVTP